MVNLAKTVDTKPELRGLRAVLVALTCTGFLAACGTPFDQELKDDLLDIRMGTGRIGPVLANTGFGKEVARAVSSHPSLAIGAAQVRGAEAKLEGARAAAWPRISFGIDVGSNLLGGAAALRSVPILTVSQLLFDGGATRARVQAARGGVVQTALSREAVVGQLTLTAVEVWYELRHQQRLLRLATQNFEEHQDFVALLKDRLSAGAGTQSDLLTAQSRLADAEARRSTVRNSLDRAQARYVEIFQDFGASETEFVAAPDMPSGTDAVLISSSPRLRSLDVEIANAEALLRATQATRWPSLSVGVSAQYDPDTEEATASASTGPSLDIFDGGRQSNTVAQAAANLEELRAERQQLELEIARALAFLRADAKSGQDRLRAARAAVEANKAAVIVIREQFTIGRIGLLQLLDSRRNLFEAEETLAGVERDIAMSGYAALTLTGDILDPFGLLLPIPALNADPAQMTQINKQPLSALGDQE